ncbi:MAG: lasso peptide biosynthesis B2 protein [Sphingomonadales bacterium]|nr:lasso peptide biosynthesis B2 protein [Sphingomonadales bacterium]
MAEAAPPDWRWRLLVGEAMVRLTLARLLVRLVPLRWWGRWLGRPAPHRPDEGLADPGAWRLSRAVLRGAARLPFETKCLPRAIALHTMLRRNRIPSRMVIAVLDPRRRGAVEDLHAWVESKGEIVIGALDFPFHPVVTYS